MNSLFLILTSIIFPILAISWLCCIGYCVYKSLLNQFKRPGRNTKVQVFFKCKCQKYKTFKKDNFCLFLNYTKKSGKKFKTKYTIIDSGNGSQSFKCFFPRFWDHSDHSFTSTNWKLDHYTEYTWNWTDQSIKHISHITNFRYVWE